MSVVEITIANRIASASAGIELVCNNPTDTIQFKFDDEWASYDLKTARFSWANSFIDVVFSGNTVQVPELMNTLYVFVGVYSDGIASTPVKLQCKRSILCLGDNEHLPPEHTNWDEFRETLEALNAAAEETNAAAERAENATTAANSATTNAENATNAANNSASAANEAADAANNATANANAAANSAIRTDALQTLTAAQKDTAQENIGLKAIVDGLTDSFSVSGNPVQCNPVGGLVFDGLETSFSPVQAGEGDPSPDNIRPISGYESLSVTRCGKNLMRRTASDSIYTSNGVTITPNSDGTYTINGTATEDVFYDMYYYEGMNGALRPGQTYTVSFGSEYAAVGKNAIMVVGCSTSSGAMYPAYSNSVESRTFTMPDDFTTSEVRIRIYAGAVFNNVTVYPSIEIGEHFTGYEPYRGDTYTAQFGQTVYGGRMNWLTGELTAEWGAADMGDLAWTLTSSYENPFFYTGVPIGVDGDAISPIYKRINNMAASGFGSYANNYEMACGEQTNQIFIRDDRYSDAAAFRTAMKGIPLVYALATPFTIQLTPQQIAAVQGVNTLYGDGDTITVNGRQPKTIALESRIEALEAAILNA